MKNLVKWLLTVTFALGMTLALAQSLTVIELRSKTADEVLPVLQPLVEPGGTLSGMNNQLFLRASPRNQEEIRRALAAIDKPARRLVIRVAQDRQMLDSASGGQASGRAWGTRSQQAANSEQRVQTVDGGRAYIQVGRSLPVPMRQIIVGPGGAVINEGVVYRDLASGFYAVPHVNGRQVTLDIAVQDAQPAGRHGRATETQQVSTTVSGRLGEWLELGGSGQQATRQGNGYSVGTAELQEQRSLWLKVDLAD